MKSVAKTFNSNNYPLQDETYQIIGVCMEVHRILGKGFLEIVYKDAIEYEMRKKKRKIVGSTSGHTRADHYLKRKER